MAKPKSTRGSYKGIEYTIGPAVYGWRIAIFFDYKDPYFDNSPNASLADAKEKAKQIIMAKLQNPRRKRKNPSSISSAATDWIPVHAIRQTADGGIQILTDEAKEVMEKLEGVAGRVINSGKRKVKRRTVKRRK